MLVSCCRPFVRSALGPAAAPRAASLAASRPARRSSPLHTTSSVLDHHHDGTPSAAVGAETTTTTTTPAGREVESVTRIQRLMHLSDTLAGGPSSRITPGRARGSGFYRHEDSGPHLAGTSTSTTGGSANEGQGPDLPKERRMRDSYVEMLLPFSRDAALREVYIGGLSQVRMGRLMEDFDSLAASAAYRYVLPDGCEPADAHKYGLYLVTAAVDRLDILRPITQGNDDAVPDLKLSGHVSYAGSSSLEVFMRLSALPSGEEGGEGETILLGRFSMACRAVSGGKQLVPKLVVSSDEERELARMGREMREQKRLARTRARELTSSDSSPPTEREARMLHQVFAGREDVFDVATGRASRSKPDDVFFIRDTRLNSATLMHPQERNVHNKVFGGFLMRLAYESAYSTACLFAQSAVSFIALDELAFKQPVEIGSLLMLDSKVTYTPLQGSHRSFHVSVEASTVNLYTSEKRVTNVFHYTFAAPRPLERQVLPKSYMDAMQWLEAMRRREFGVEVRNAFYEAVSSGAGGNHGATTPKGA